MTNEEVYGHWQDAVLEVCREQGVSITTETDLPANEYDRDLLNYVKLLYKCGGSDPLWKLFHDKGLLYTREALTIEEQAIVDKARARKFFRPHGCFANAQRLVLADESGQLQYVEGYVLVMVPIHHGFAVINGKVLEPTINREGSNYGSKRGFWGSVPDNLAYYGLPIPKHILLKRRPWSLFEKRVPRLAILREYQCQDLERKGEP